MEPEEIEKTLQESGLNKNEAKIYLAALELGTAKNNEIAVRAKLLRTTAYEVLMSLVKKGLASFVIKSGIKYFSVVDPSRLIEILNHKVEQVKKALPFLKKIKASVGKRPVLELYEGKDGLKTLYNDILNTLRKGDEEIGYGNTKLLMKIVPYFPPQHMQRRADKGIKARIVTEPSKESKEIQRRDKKEFRQTRFLDFFWKMEVFCYIYKNKLAILSFSEKEPIGIIIDNKEYADAQRIIFESYWEIASQ